MIEYVENEVLSVKMILIKEVYINFPLAIKMNKKKTIIAFTGSD